MKKVRMYIPKDIGEVRDQLNSMLLRSPKFIDNSGLFPIQSIDVFFKELNDGLMNIKNKIGEARYNKMILMSDEARACFEADPENSTGETWKGREILVEMEISLRPSSRRA